MWRRTEQKVPTFATRGEAFDFMFARLVANGEDMMAAAEKANKFADIVQTNKCLPSEPQKPLTGIERGVVYIEKIAQVKRDHPEVWSLVTGLLGGIVGGFTAIGSAPQPIEEKHEEIDFEKLK